MERKRFSPLKLAAAIAFFLVAVISMFHFCRDTISLIDYLINYRARFLYVLGDLMILSYRIMFILGYLLLGVSCFLRKPRLLAICGAVLLLAGVATMLTQTIVFGYLIYPYGITNLKQLFRQLGRLGKVLRNMFNIGFVLYLSYVAVQVIAYIAAAFVLLLNKKAPKFLCFVPSVLMVGAPLWYIFYNTLLFIFDRRFSLANILGLYVNAGIIIGVLEAVGFALLLLLTTAKEKVAVAQESEVIEEAPVQEEIPMAEEAAAE